MRVRRGELTNKSEILAQTVKAVVGELLYGVLSQKFKTNPKRLGKAVKLSKYSIFSIQIFLY